MQLSESIDYKPISQIEHPLMHIASPFTGRVAPIAYSPDKLIASGIIGQGVAVKMNVALMLAPFDGIVIEIRAQGTEYILQNKQKLRCLIKLTIPEEFKRPEFQKAQSYGKKQFKQGEVICFFDLPQVSTPVFGACILLNASSKSTCYYPLKQVSAGKDPLITIARA